MKVFMFNGSRLRLSGLAWIQVKRHHVAGKRLEKIQKRASVGLTRYPIERKTHQSLLTQHLRDVSDRLKSVPPRLISTSFSIVYSPPFSRSFFSPFILRVYIGVTFSLSRCDDRYPELHSPCFTRMVDILCSDKKNNKEFLKNKFLMYLNLTFI